MAAVPAMQGDDAAAREWLGGNHGGFDLSTQLTDVLLAGFNRDPDPVWTMDDVPVLGDVRTSSALVRLWRSFLLESEAEAGVALADSRRLRFELWLTALIGKDEDGTIVKYVPEEQEKKDLAAQGMSDHRQLRRLELSLHLCRAVGDKEIENGEYGVPPNNMVGGKNAVKALITTFDKVLDAAVKAKDVTAVENHIINTTGVLSGRTGNAWDRANATVINTWWMETTRTVKDETARLKYIVEYRKYYMGRGFPVNYDPRIGQGALNSVIASSAGGTDFDDMKAQFAALAKQNESLSSRVQSLLGEVRALKAPKPPMPKGCWNCGSDDHQGKDCPNPIDPEKKKAFFQSQAGGS